MIILFSILAVASTIVILFTFVFAALEIAFNFLPDKLHNFIFKVGYICFSIFVISIIMINLLHFILK